MLIFSSSLVLFCFFGPTTQFAFFKWKLDDVTCYLNYLNSVDTSLTRCILSWQRKSDSLCIRVQKCKNVCRCHAEEEITYIVCRQPVSPDLKNVSFFFVCFVPSINISSPEATDILIISTMSFSFWQKRKKTSADPSAQLLPGSEQNGGQPPDRAEAWVLLFEPDHQADTSDVRRSENIDGGTEEAVLDGRWSNRRSPVVFFPIR